MTTSREHPEIDPEKETLIEEVKYYIRKNYSRGRLDEKQLGSRFGMEPDTLAEVFSAYAGKSLKAYIRDTRMLHISRVVMTALACAILLSGCSAASLAGKTTAAGTASTAAASAASGMTADETKYSVTSADGKVTYTCGYEAKNYVTLADPAAVTVDATLETYVNDELDEMCSSYQYLPTDETKCADGKTIAISYAANLDGDKEMNQDLSCELAVVTLDKDGYYLCDGFEEALLTAQTGKIIKKTLTLPDDYEDTDYAGKKVTFQIVVNAVLKDAEVTHENMTDRYAKVFFAYDTVEALKEALQESAKSSFDSQLTTNVRSAVLEDYLNRCTFAGGYPDSLKEEATSAVSSELQYYADTYNYTYDNYVGQYFDNETALENYALDTYDEQLQTKLVLTALLQSGKVSLSQKGYETYLQGLVDSYADVNSVDNLVADYGETVLMQQYCLNAATDYLVSQASVTYSETK